MVFLTEEGHLYSLCPIFPKTCTISESNFKEIYHYLYNLRAELKNKSNFDYQQTKKLIKALDEGKRSIKEDNLMC